MLTTVKTILTKEDDRHHENGVRAAHFVNGYIKRERKNKRKVLEEDGTFPHTTDSRGETTLTYHLMYIPRILKNDLRRQYPVMFANVYNACDYDFMMKFLYQFGDASGRVTMCDTYVNNDGPPCILAAEAQGFENCGKLWSFRLNDAPDLCFQLQSMQIRVRSDGTCTCEAKHKYSGTAIIYVNPKKIPKILKTCKVNDDGILVLPNLPSPGIFIRQANHPIMDNQAQSGGEDLLATELKELFEVDQQLLSEFVHSLQGEDPFEHISEQSNSSSLLDEESEYLFSVFTDLMNPARSAPRTPDFEETLPLGFPYEYNGDLFIHINEESKIHRLDLRATLITKS